MRLGLTALGLCDYSHVVKLVCKNTDFSVYTYIHKKFYIYLVNMGILIISYKLLKQTSTPIISYLKKQVEIVRKTVPKVTNNRVGIHNTNLTKLLAAV